jgi:hypothetical protein
VNPIIIYLFFTACIDSRCHEVGLASFPSIAACSTAAMPAVAEWMGQHPAYTSFKHVTCSTEPPDEGQDL